MPFVFSVSPHCPILSSGCPAFPVLILISPNHITSSGSLYIVHLHYEGIGQGVHDGARDEKVSVHRGDGFYRVYLEVVSAVVSYTLRMAMRLDYLKVFLRNFQYEK